MKSSIRTLLARNHQIAALRQKAVSISRRIGRPLMRLRAEWRLRHIRRTHDREYTDYVDAQVKRTVLRHHRVNGNMPLLIDLLFQHAPVAVDASVLCIGSRKASEIDYFRSKGISKVIGIDLVSTSPDILVMDMHAMTFPDDQFDVIYSSHSLEHAYDDSKVVAEIVRVARPGAFVIVEVPLRFAKTAADRVDYGSADGVVAAFAPHVERVLFAEELPPHVERNLGGTNIARVLLRLNKANEL
jgi:SAM-dependent methyltransferase